MNISLYYFWKKVITPQAITELNKTIKQNFLQGTRDSPASRSVKTSSVQCITYGIVRNQIKPYVDRALSCNESVWGYDLYPLIDDKVLNYNVYRPKTEYSWHVDMNRNANYDMKLTILINLSEHKYTGGKFQLFEGGALNIEEFTEPGDMVIFPSFVNHRVTQIRSGTRQSLALWLNGPKWR